MVSKIELTLEMYDAQHLFEKMLGLSLFGTQRYFIISNNLFTMLESYIHMEISPKKEEINNVVYQYKELFYMVKDMESTNTLINCTITDIQNMLRSKKLKEINKNIKNG